jgi:hypothetical protein
MIAVFRVFRLLRRCEGGTPSRPDNIGFEQLLPPCQVAEAIEALAYVRTQVVKYRVCAEIKCREAK